MRHVAAVVAVFACWACSGCATGMTRPQGMAQSTSGLSRSAASARHQRVARRNSVENPNRPYAHNRGDDPEFASSPPADRYPAAVRLAEYTEEIPPPPPDALEAVTKADDISDPDALSRRVVDVPVDIRPQQGELPTDLAASAFARDAQADDELASRPRPQTVVAWTPWKICYRPLYFEEVSLERYGCNLGIAQPGISAAHFFFGAGLIPYKIISRFPTSCECSNGFSRCGDAPPPGYEDYRIHLDAAAVEAAILTGIVLSLP